MNAGAPSIEVTARIWPCVQLQYAWLGELPAADPKPQLVPRPALAARLAARNADLPPHTFRVTEAQLDLWLSLFEPPTPDELLPRI